MSKDKGGKNHKKPKADKNAGKKVMSSYKAESQGKKGQSTLEVFTPKSDGSAGGGNKKNQ
jgi:hypothetical protein